MPINVPWKWQGPFDRSTIHTPPTNTTAPNGWESDHHLNFLEHFLQGQETYPHRIYFHFFMMKPKQSSGKQKHEKNTPPNPVLSMIQMLERGSWLCWLTNNKEALDAELPQVLDDPYD